jgi:hypothetical protein
MDLFPSPGEKGRKGTYSGGAFRKDNVHSMICLSYSTPLSEFVNVVLVQPKPCLKLQTSGKSALKASLASAIAAASVYYNDKFISPTATLKTVYNKLVTQNLRCEEAVEILATLCWVQEIVFECTMVTVVETRC